MNIVVNSQTLAGVLRLLNKIVPSKPPIPILGHTLVTATDGALAFFATDLEISRSVNCTASIDEPGTAALPVAKLLQMVEQFPDDDVLIAVIKDQATIKCGAFTSKLQLIPASVFPSIPTPLPDSTSCKIDASLLRDLITKTRHAVSATSTKYVLKGALLECTDRATSMIATEGRRLAWATGTGNSATVRIVIPSKMLDLLVDDGEDGTYALTIGSRHLFFALSNGGMLSTRIIEGEFPAYERFVPRDNTRIIEADRSLLAAALRRVTLAAEENSAVYFDVAPGLLSLSAASAGIGSASEPMPVVYDGEPLKVCMNGAYVLDFLNATTEPTVTLALKDVRTAALLTASVDHVGVIMLMRS